MKLKLYLRGLGIGLMIGALTLMIFGGGKGTAQEKENTSASTLSSIANEEATDENEEETSLYAAPTALATDSSDLGDSTVSSQGESKSSEINEELPPAASVVTQTDTEKAQMAENGQENSAASVQTSVTGTEKTAAKVETETSGANVEASAVVPEDGEIYATDTTSSSYAQGGTLVAIPGGSDSTKVSQILQNAGVIDNAADFDSYLVQSGKDRRIRSGTFYVNQGSSYGEIAALISNG